MKRFYIAGYKESLPIDGHKGKIDEHIIRHLENNNTFSLILRENLLLICAHMEGHDLVNILAGYTNYRGIKDTYAFEIDINKIYYWNPGKGSINSVDDNVTKFIEDMNKRYPDN